MLHAQRRAIVQPVKIGQRLKVGLVLDQLFGAAVQQADVRIDPLDNLAVQLHDHAQHAVRRRMLGAEVDRVVGDDLIAGGRRLLKLHGHALPLRLFIAGQDVFRPFPRAHEIELPQVLRQLHRLIDHALVLFGIAQFLT